MQFKGVIKQITSRKTDINGETGILFYVASKDAKMSRDEYGRVRCIIKNKRLLSLGLPAVYTGSVQGNCFVVNEIKPAYLGDLNTVNYLTKRFKGLNIKKSTIVKIVEAYGGKLFTYNKEELLSALNEDFDELGVTIDKIVSELYDPKPIDVLSEYLEKFDFDENVIHRIFEIYGSDAVKEIKKNPYNIILSMELPLIVADIIASKEGISGLDNRRIEGYVRNVLNKAEKNGDTFVYGTELIESVLNEFERRHIVYGNTVVNAIDIANALAESTNFILTDDGKISLKRLYRAEETIARRLKSLLSCDVDKIDVTLEMIARKEDELNITFGQSQREAIKLSGKDNVCVLTGGAGVGKTTVVKTITDIYHEKYPKNTIVFCAPTGRAAKRLQLSVTPYKASTIHHLLGMRPGFCEMEITHNQNNPLDADFIIVDESSMAEVELMSFLLNAIKNGSKLLIVGDENQLPSVGAGNFLHDVIKSGIVPVYRLTDIYRQSENSGIVQNSNNILSGNELLSTDDFIMHECDSNFEGRKTLYRLIDKEFDINDPYGVQIIEPMNKDVSDTNMYVHHKFVSDENGLAVSDKVMFKQNASGLEFVNGEFGVVRFVSKSEMDIISEDNVKKTISSENVYENLRLAYSVTVHKMQGSEAREIIILLPDNCSQMMNKQLLYTAVTRAKDVVHLISVNGSAKDCVGKEMRIRNTRLSDMLVS